MENFTFRLGGLADEQHVAEELELPLIKNLGAVTACKKALDRAATTRRAVTVLGPKGMGKTIGLRLACDFFASLERAMQERDSSYRLRRVLRLRAARGASYREMAVHLAKQLNPAFSDRVRGRKKEQNEIRTEILGLCLKQQYAVIAIDEGEVYSDESLLLLRDLMADSEDEDPARFRSPDTTAAAGVGIVIVGTDDKFLDRLSVTGEAGERWSLVIRVATLKPAAVRNVYAAWFPGFAEYIATVGEPTWEAYLSSLIARGGDVSFRQLENHARAYVHYLARTSEGCTNPRELPFNRHLFELAAEESAWAKGRVASPAKKTGRGRSRKPAAAGPAHEGTP
jgi:hypothetical protein